MVPGENPSTTMSAFRSSSVKISLPRGSLRFRLRARFPAFVSISNDRSVVRVKTVEDLPGRGGTLLPSDEMLDPPNGAVGFDSGGCRFYLPPRLRGTSRLA